MNIKFKMEFEKTNQNNTCEKTTITEFSINGYMPSKEKIEDYFYNIVKEHNIKLLPRGNDPFFTSIYLPVNFKHDKYSNSAFIETRVSDSKSTKIWFFVEEEKQKKARL